MSRHRFNGLPVNWWIILFSFLIAFFVSESYRDAVNNGLTPARVTAAQFPGLVASGANRKYISITGELHPELALDVKDSSTGNLESRVIPMIDRKTQTGLFISAHPNLYDGVKPGMVTVTGMMWGVSPDVKSDLPGEAARISGHFPKPINFQNGMWLTEGRAPGKANDALLGVVAGSVIGFLFLLPILFRYVIFQRTGKLETGAVNPFSHSRALADQEGTNPEIKLEGLRLTGKLRLHEKCAMRFLDMPGNVTLLKDGQLAFISHINASPSMNGAVTEQRVGLWLIVPRLSTLTWEEGRLYNGLRGWPAVRLRYQDELEKGKKARAILSFETEAQREALLRELSKNKR